MHCTYLDFFQVFILFNLTHLSEIIYFPIHLPVSPPNFEISEIKTLDISKVPYETMTLLYKAKGLFENISILKFYVCLFE